MKKLWILKRESNVYEHDVVEAMVVRASNSLMARELAKSKSQDEGVGMKYKVAGKIQPDFNTAVGKSVKHCLKYGDALDIEVVDSKGKTLKIIVVESVRVEYN